MYVAGKLYVSTKNETLQDIFKYCLIYLKCLLRHLFILIVREKNSFYT